METTTNTKEQLPELFSKQISLTEWLEGIDHVRKQDMRNEDSGKSQRLEMLHKLIGLPYDQPTTFSAEEISTFSSRLVAYIEKEGNSLCALRLSPIAEGLPKLRIRGSTVRHAVEKWFPAQAINPKLYRADFFMHPLQTNWSTIFIVNKHGIFGELISGGHHQLTQGFYDEARPRVFSFDFQTKKVRIHSQNQAALAYVYALIKHVHVASDTTRRSLNKNLGVTFAANYLCGYFESVDSEFGTTFIDFNRLLGQLYADFVCIDQGSPDSVIRGIVGSPGKVIGKVNVVDDPLTSHVRNGEILVCDVTTPAFLPLMKQAAAIITDRGGMLSHAAITARELKKPCIVGAGNATRVLKDKQVIEVDATSGIVRRIG